jgi:hypothetical protein
MSQQQNSPSILCPSCGNLVTLPAEECGQCHYNFRTGKKPALELQIEREAPNRKPYLIGASVLALILLVVLFIFLGGEDPEPIANPPSAGGSILQPLPSTQENIGLKPAQTINTTNAVADQANERVEQLEQLQKELDAQSQ